MSSCIKNVYGYNLVKKCSKCGIISMKSIFHKSKLTKNGVRSECIICRRKYYIENQEKSKKCYSENRDRINNNQKLYKKQNRAKINLYEKKRRETDFVYKIANSLRVRINKTIRSQNVRKTNKTFALLGCSHSFLRLWIESQLYGETTLENYGKIWCLDHFLPIVSFNLLDENDIKKCFNWIYLRLMYIKDNISKGSKIDYRLYLLQEVKAKYFLKLNNDQQGFN